SPTHEGDNSSSPSEVLPRFVESGDSDALAHATTVEIVHGEVNTAPQSGLPRLVGSVEVRRPLQLKRGRRPLFKKEIAGCTVEACKTARKVWAAGEPCQHLGRGSTEGAM